MDQKVVKIGSSAGVTLPKTVLRDLGIKIGDMIRLESDKRRRRVSIVPSEEKFEIDPKTVELTTNFIKKYRKDLEALADK